jgi:Rieske Fe-S protein
MERREFIRTSGALCASVAAAGLLGSMLSSCVSFPAYKTTSLDNIVTVPVSLFAATNIQIIRANNYLYDIALKKEGDGAYNAFLLECTHASNPLTFTGDKFRCSLHGSTYDQKGNVEHGPAVKSLKHLPVIVSSNEIRITLPSFG